MSRFKVGDRVISLIEYAELSNDPLKGQVGTIVIYRPGEETMGVRWDNFAYNDDELIFEMDGLDCHGYVDDELMLEEVYNSPLMRALREE